MSGKCLRHNIPRKQAGSATVVYSHSSPWSPSIDIGNCHSHRVRDGTPFQSMRPYTAPPSNCQFRCNQPRSSIPVVAVTLWSYPAIHTPSHHPSAPNGNCSSCCRYWRPSPCCIDPMHALSLQHNIPVPAVMWSATVVCSHSPPLSRSSNICYIHRHSVVVSNPPLYNMLYRDQPIPMHQRYLQMQRQHIHFGLE